MLKKYRRQFITLNICLVGAVLLLTLILIGGYMARNAYQELETTMSEVVKPLSLSMVDMPGTGVWRYDYDGDEADFPEDRSEESPESETEPPAIPEGEASRNTQLPVDPSAGQQGPAAQFQPGTGLQVPQTDNPTGAEPEVSLQELEERRSITTVMVDGISGAVMILSEDTSLEEERIIAAVKQIVQQSEDFGELADLDLLYYRQISGEGYKIALTEADYFRSTIVSLVLILSGVFLAAMLLFFFISWKISGFAMRPLEEAMAREKQFVADASHDLKTPLTVILANTSILQSNPDSTVAQQMQWIDSTAQAAVNMQGMVNGMLTLSGMETGAKPALEPVNFSDVAERAGLQMESVAYDGGVGLESEIQESLTILANREALERVVGSLIENALKYEPQGGKVRMKLAQEGGSCVLTVQNFGSFISQEDLPHIFERFYRADKTRGTGGHGLGLAIAKSTVEQLGGTLAAESAPAIGTIFTVRFKKA